MEERQNEILEVALDRLEQEGMWFTTKEDKLYANAKDLYKLDKYGELEDKSKERLVNEVEQHFGDGAAFVIEAVDQWLQDNLIEGIIGYVDTLAMNFEIPEIIETIEAHDEQGVDDLDTTIAEEADLPEGVEREKKEEGKKVEAYNYYWEDDILEVDPNTEASDDIWYMVAENIQQTDPDYADWDVFDIMGDIISIWKIEKRSRLYDCLLKWYGSEEELLKNVRDVLDTNDAIYFVTGCGYSIWSADLLGGTADGVAKRDFDRFVENGCKKEEAKVEEAEDTVKDVLSNLNVSTFAELNEEIERLWDEEVIDDDQYEAFCDICSDRESKCETYIRKRAKVTNTDWKDEIGIEADYVTGAIQDMIATLGDIITEAAEDYSKPVKVGDKWFRYNYKYSELEYITHPSNEHGPIEVIDSVGLSVENWDDKAEREAYIQGWIEDLDVIEDTMSKDVADEFGYLFPKRLQEISKGVDCMHYGYNGDDGYRYVFDNKSKMEKAKEYLGQFGSVTEVQIEDIIDYIDEDEYKKVKGCLMVKFDQGALEEGKEEKVEENTKLEEDNDRDFDAFQRYIMDNVYCDSETLMTTPEIIEDNAGTIAEDAAKQVVNEILGETEYTGLYHSMINDYEEEIKRIILNNIDRIVYLQNVEQEEIMAMINEGKAKNLTEALNLLEKNKVQEVRTHRTLQKGDVYENENGVKIQVIDVTDDKSQVTLKFQPNGEAVCIPMENANNMLDLNKYRKLDECDAVNFNGRTKDKLEEGVRQRLDERNEQSAGIIEQALQSINENTSETESGIITKTSELFQQLSDRGYDVQVSFDNGESTSSIAIGQQGANVLITITDPEQPLRAFASGNFELNDDSVKMIKNILDVL